MQKESKKKKGKKSKKEKDDSSIEFENMTEVNPAEATKIIKRNADEEKTWKEAQWFLGEVPLKGMTTHLTFLTAKRTYILSKKPTQSHNSAQKIRQAQIAKQSDAIAQMMLEGAFFKPGNSKHVKVSYLDLTRFFFRLMQKMAVRKIPDHAYTACFVFMFLFIIFFFFLHKQTTIHQHTLQATNTSKQQSINTQTKEKQSFF